MAVPESAYKPKNWLIMESGAMRAIIVRLMQKAAVMVIASTIVSCDVDDFGQRLKIRERPERAMRLRCRRA